MDGGCGMRSCVIEVGGWGSGYRLVAWIAGWVLQSLMKAKGILEKGSIRRERWLELSRNRELKSKPCFMFPHTPTFPTL